ncbi:MAG: hypothetical protein QGG40_22040, partial [Myxococcota bacterium]|nr:hypothetical protein [Myxococcota bacterium]
MSPLIIWVHLCLFSLAYAEPEETQAKPASEIGADHAADLVDESASTPQVSSLPRSLDVALALDFGDHLLQTHQLADARSWYRLVLFMDEPGVDRNIVHFRLGLAYERDGLWSQAVESYLQVGDEDADPNVAGQARDWRNLEARGAYRAALCDFRAGGEDRESGLTEVARAYADTSWGRQAPYTSAVMWLEQRDLARAHVTFLRLSLEDGDRGDPWRERAEDFAARTRTPPEYRSPVLAGALGLVPGLGHAYVGQPLDGAAVALLNGTLGVWSASLLSRGLREDRWFEVGA